MLGYLRALWKGNPVRVASIAASGVVFAAAKAGVVLDEASVGEALLTVVPILLGGEVARAQVSPHVGDVGQPSDELLDLSKAPAP
jgi:hypothetical protein